MWCSWACSRASHICPAISIASLGLKKPFREEAGKSLYKGSDLAKAKEFLKKGLEELKMDKLPTLDLLMDDDDIAKKHGEKMQADLKSVGIDVRLVPLPWGEKLTRLQNGEFAIMASGWGPDYLDPSTYLDLFETEGGNNYGQFSNPEFDKLVRAARTELDPAKRMGYFYQAEKILVDHMAVAPRYFRIAHYTPKDYLTGVVLRGSGASTDYYWADVDMVRKMELTKK
jgi:oligopeptide transport system substrate-binding protein